MNKFVIYILLLLTALQVACKDKSPKKDLNTKEEAKLTSELAKQIFALPVHCLTIEYPNKLGQVIGSDADLKSPKQLRPIFYGCFDWHSSVHGYWSIIKLMKQFPELDTDGNIRKLLNEHITEEHVAVEKAFFEDKNNLSFERTYGWAWLFKLQEELHTWKDPDAKRWEKYLEPLVHLLVQRYMEYLPKLVYPIRAGQHDNSAFGLSLPLDYAKTLGNKPFESSIKEHALRLFQHDKNCDLNYEPSGYDFLSPCLEEAFLMSKIMEQMNYDAWLKLFMPELYEEQFDLKPAVVKDRSDGKLVHLDGLNYSRAACLNGIAKAVPALNHLNTVANDHVQFSIGNIHAKDDYMGSHWLGTFALYALTNK